MKYTTLLLDSLVPPFAGRGDSAKLTGEKPRLPGRLALFCRSRRSLLALGCVGLSVIFAGKSHASDWTGNNEDGTRLWNDVLNWSAGVAGNTGATGGPGAVFNVDNGVTTITIDENRWVPSIAFGANAGAYTLGSEGPNGGFALHLAALSSSVPSTVVMNADMLHDVNFHAPIVLEGHSTWTNNNTSFDIHSEGTLEMKTNSFLTLRGVGETRMDGLITGVSGLIKDDAGTVYLNNANNSFTGTVQIKSGAFNTISINNVGTDSGLGRGNLIALGDNRRDDSLGRLIVSSPTGGSTNRLILFRTGNNADSANGSGGILESAVAGQTVTFNGFVRAQNTGDSGIYSAESLTPGEEYRSYLELTGVGNGVMAGIVGGVHVADIEKSINMELRKTGSGVWELREANLYHRGTLVEEGTLLANNTAGSATGTSSVLVSAGATLGGTGSITGGTSESITLGVGSQLMIGASHGAGGTAHDLVLGNSATANNVALNLHGTLQFDIMGAGSMAALGDVSYHSLGTANDLLEIFTTGDIDLSDAMVQIAAEDTSLWEAGQSWKLIDWSNVDFDSLDTTDLTLETTVIGNYLLTHSILEDGYYVTASLVPEPARGLLLLAGVACVSLRRRRKPVK